MLADIHPFTLYLWYLCSIQTWSSTWNNVGKRRSRAVRRLHKQICAPDKPSPDRWKGIPYAGRKQNIGHQSYCLTGQPLPTPHTCPLTYMTESPIFHLPAIGHLVGIQTPTRDVGCGAIIQYVLLRILGWGGSEREQNSLTAYARPRISWLVSGTNWSLNSSSFTQIHYISITDFKAFFGLEVQ